MTGADDRLLGLALTAFPRRWRASNEAELRDVHESLGGSTSAAELADLVAGGVRVRLADRPPFGVWARYALMNTPVPPRWHGWMHDQVTSRWFPLTSSLPFVVFFLLVVAGPEILTGTSPSWWAFSLYPAAMLLGGLAGGHWKRPKVQRRISALIGYDIATDEWRAASKRFPARSAPWFQPTPKTRIAVDLYGRPVGFWLLTGGLALIVGSARPNDVGLDIGFATLVPDGNSPLTSSQVWLALAATLAAAAGLNVAWRWLLFRRSGRLTVVSGHPLNTSLSTRAFWVITAAPGMCAVLLGLLGVLPDQACTGVGAAMFVLGTLVLTADCVARRSGDRVGREVSLAELLVGEQLVALPPPPLAEDRLS